MFPKRFEDWAVSRFQRDDDRDTFVFFSSASDPKKAWLYQAEIMNHLSLKLGSVGDLIALSAFVTIGIVTPQPVGACSCLLPFVDLEITEIRLMNPGDLDDSAVEELEAEEALIWPETASLDAMYYFDGIADDEFIAAGTATFTDDTLTFSYADPDGNEWEIVYTVTEE